MDRLIRAEVEPGSRAMLMSTRSPCEGGEAL